jgi:hypothetical protein
MAAFEEQLVRGDVGGWALPFGEMDLELIGDGGGDFILDGEDVGHLAVVTLGPEMVSIRGLDELGRHADAVTGLADAPFQNMLDAELAGDLRNFHILALEGISEIIMRIAEV